MPFGKSFNIVLESASESENDAFLLLDSTAHGVDVEDRVIALDASKTLAQNDIFRINATNLSIELK